jgi:hypothetical protein
MTGFLTLVAGTSTTARGYALPVAVNGHDILELVRQ